jgi:peptidoglycan/LPS O-acetylase OafA/YrhL
MTTIASELAAVPPARVADKKQKLAYLPTINGFRGICVTMVFLHHVGNSGLPPVADPASFWQTGLHELLMSFRYGVELFFMISGYVILNSLRRHASLGGFLQDRALRIFPVWLPIAVLLVAASTVVGRDGFQIAPFWYWVARSGANILLIPPLWELPLAHPASWSLTYEWVFYLASAAAAFLWRRPGTPGIVKAAWLAAVVLLICAYPRALFFVPGVMVAMKPEWMRGMRRVPALAFATLPLFLFAWLSTGIVPAEYSKPLWTVLMQGHVLGVVVAFLAGLHLFACVTAPEPKGLGVLSGRMAQHLGTISYSLYLVHPLVMSAVKFVLLRVMPGAHGSWLGVALFTVVSALLSWGLSYLSWLWLEQRLGRWLKARLAPGRNAPPAPGMPASADLAAAVPAADLRADGSAVPSAAAPDAGAARIGR